MIFVLWYNIDFVICGSLKCMCTVVSYLFLFFLKREKPYFEGWETKKKIYCTFIYFWIFLRVIDSIKIKHLFQRCCRNFCFRGHIGHCNFYFKCVCFKGHLDPQMVFNTFFLRVLTLEKTNFVDITDILQLLKSKFANKAWNFKWQSWGLRVNLAYSILIWLGRKFLLLNFKLAFQPLLYIFLFSLLNL